MAEGETKEIEKKGEPAPTEGVEGDKTKKTYARKKKDSKVINVGNVYIQSTFNNTIVTITDLGGNVIAWSSSGREGFKGSRKSTPFAAQVAAENAIKKALDFGMRSVSVYVSGPGVGREAALRALGGTGVRVSLIKDITPIPHNGCRAPKRRRV